MQTKICETKATTLKELQAAITHAISHLGRNALWTGYEDGSIYLWRENEKVQLAISPGKKYQSETVWMELVA